MFRTQLTAAALLLCLTAPGNAAGPEQVGTFTGTLTSKGVNPITGEKIKTKSTVVLSVAADNSTTLTIDGVDHHGAADNFFGPELASLVLLGPGPTVITAPISFKNGKVKGIVNVFSFVSPFITTTGKLKLKSTSTTALPGFNGANSIFASTDTPIPIADNSTLTSTLTIPSVGLISDVNVTLDITHTFVGDLDIFLLSPTGKSVELTTDNGGSGDNYTNTEFDDSATSGITSIVSANAPFTASFKPESQLSFLNLDPSGGNWQLIVRDDAGGDTGSLTSWTLELNSASLSDIF